MTEGTSPRLFLAPLLIYFLVTAFLFATSGTALPFLGSPQPSNAPQGLSYIDEDEHCSDLAFPEVIASASKDWIVQSAQQSKQVQSLLPVLDTLAPPALITSRVQSILLSVLQNRPVLYHRKVAPLSSNNDLSPS